MPFVHALAWVSYSLLRWVDNPETPPAKALQDTLDAVARTKAADCSRLRRKAHTVRCMDRIVGMSGTADTLDSAHTAGTDRTAADTAACVADTAASAGDTAASAADTADVGQSAPPAVAAGNPDMKRIQDPACNADDSGIAARLECLCDALSAEKGGRRNVGDPVSVASLVKDGAFVRDSYGAADD